MTKPGRVRFSYILPVAVLATLVFSISLQSVLADWTAPTLAPADGNMNAPINVGSANQSMLGGLAVGGALAVTGNSSFAGNVGIGTTNPLAGRLAVVSDGFAAFNARSAADAAADGSANVTALRSVDLDSSHWANARYDAYSHAFGYGSSASVNTAMTILGSNGNVGIGTISPTAKLQVVGDFKLGTTPFKVYESAGTCSTNETFLSKYTPGMTCTGVSCAGQAYPTSCTVASKITTVAAEAVPSCVYTSACNGVLVPGYWYDCTPCVSDCCDCSGCWCCGWGAPATCWSPEYWTYPPTYTTCSASWTKSLCVGI